MLLIADTIRTNDRTIICPGHPLLEKRFYSTNCLPDFKRKEQHPVMSDKKEDGGKYDFVYNLALVVDSVSA